MKYSFRPIHIKILSIIIILICLCACGNNKNTKPVIDNGSKMEE